MFALAVDSADDASAPAPATPEGPATPKTPPASQPPASQPPASAPGGGATAPPVSNVCILGCVTLLGSNAKVSITEIQKSHGVDYEINVLDKALTVTAFGVTNIANDGYSTRDSDKFWGNEYLSESAWNAGFEFSYLNQKVLTSALGLFDDLFGLKEDHVAFFYLANNKSTDGVDSTAKGFSLFLAVPKSEFAAFSGKDLVSQSSVNDVPEPSTLAIFALGLMGLASRRFNKKS
jgi:hypothetical protein